MIPITHDIIVYRGSSYYQNIRVSNWDTSIESITLKAEGLI